MAAQTTTGLSNEIMTYYESKFLERAKDTLVYKEGAQMKTHGTNSGKSILFNRYTPLTRATTPLTEGTNPSEDNITSSTVTATLSEYGNTLKVSKLLSLTSIDTEGKEKAELLGQNMGETLDRLVRTELVTGATTLFANSKSSLANVAVTDVLTSADIRKAVRNLKAAKALAYADGNFIGKVGPYTEFDLRGDSTWVNAHTYSDTKELYNGEIGRLHGVRFLVSTDQYSEASTTTVYSNFIHGANAFGCFDLEKDTPKMYVKVPTASDTSNPADRYSTMAWAGTFCAKTLVGAWIINLKTGATA